MKSDKVEEVEKLIVDWLKSENENATYLAEQICVLFNTYTGKLKRNDFVEYVGGSNSKYLRIGQIYRLTCPPYRDRICIINDSGKRMNTLWRYFKHD